MTEVIRVGKIWVLFGVLVLFTAGGAAWAQTGPVAYYPFDGDAQDHSGNGNHGINTGAAFTAGVKGQALSFDGIDDYIRINESDAFHFGTGSATFTAWIKTTSSGEYDVILGTNWNPSEIMVIRKNSKDKVQVIFSTGEAAKGEAEGTTSINDGRWHFVAGVRDAENNAVRIYVDGVEEDYGVDDSGSLRSTADWGIGNLIGTTGYPKTVWFEGEIDEVKIYDYALSAGEIEALYDDIMKQPQLLAYYPLDGDTNDYSGNGNNGANIGAAFTEGVKGLALSFDGIDDYVRIPESSSYYFGTGGATLSAWMRTTSAGENDVILGTNWASAASMQIRKDANNRARAIFETGNNQRGTAQGTTSINDGRWHFVAGVRDAESNAVRIYVDGVEEGHGADGSGSIKDTIDWGIGNIIGSTNYPSTLWFQGEIDEIKVYNYALSAEEIRSEYEQATDTDGDGITDDRDRCRDEAGPACNEGCPTTDPDGDGFQESSQDCPDYDLCPGEYSATNNGCPELQETVHPPATTPPPAPETTRPPATTSPPVAVDSDGDGWTDDYEEKAGTNPYIMDTDNDGLIDSEDPNPLEPKKGLGVCGPSALLVLALIPILWRRLGG
jgi:hypothetical protein